MRAKSKASCRRQRACYSTGNAVRAVRVAFERIKSRGTRPGNDLPGSTSACQRRHLAGT